MLILLIDSLLTDLLGGGGGLGAFGRTPLFLLV